MLRRTLTRPAHLKPSQCSFLRLPGRSAVSGICSRSSRRTHIVSAYTASTSSSVKIVIHGRKLPVTDAIRQYIDSKIQRAVHNFAHTVKEIDVTVSARGGDTGTKGPREQKVDVTIHTLRNGVLCVEDAESALYASIDLVCDKVERKLRKLKERSIANGTWHGRAGPHIDVDGEAFKEYLQEVIYETRVSEEIEKQHELEVLSSDFPATIVRSKVLPLQPMAVEEAVEQLEQLGHDFFVFLEKQSGTVQVLYKRRMEGYGLLIPKTQSA